MMRLPHFFQTTCRSLPADRLPGQRAALDSILARSSPSRLAGWRFLRNTLLPVALVHLLLSTATAQVQTTYSAREPERSMASKFSSSIKSGFGKMTHAFKPKPSTQETSDPISLSVPATPSAEFHVAVARMTEQSGDSAKAEFHYRQALQLEPKNFDALMGYAHMLDRQDKLAQAAEIYRKVITTYPTNPTAHNDLGICCARQGNLQEAIASLEKAIQLEPKQTRYRNNLATILVQSHQIDRAFSHLAAVHPRPVACYNLGYLLQKTGDKEGAIRLFQEALALDSSMADARIWLEQLQPTMPVAPGVTPPQTARQPQAMAQRSAPMPNTTVPPPGSAAPLPPAGSTTPPPHIPMAAPTTAPNQEPPRQIAPLPSIKPLPPIYTGH